jgi:hypothetical protein
MAKQRNQATIDEMWEAVFSMRSAPRLHKESILICEFRRVSQAYECRERHISEEWITRADWEELVRVVVSSKYEWNYVLYLHEIAELRAYISREPTKLVIILTHWGDEKFLVGQLVDHIGFSAPLSVIPDIEELPTQRRVRKKRQLLAKQVGRPL